MTDQNPDYEPSLSEVLGNARVRFWMCPVIEHGERSKPPDAHGVRWPEVIVEWDEDGIAHCTAPGCEYTSLNDPRRQPIPCCNEVEQDDGTAPLCDGMMHPGWPTFICDKCGAHCGAQVHPEHPRSRDGGTDV